MNRLFLRTAAAFLAAVLLYPAPAEAISAQKAILMDGLTGRVLYAKQAQDRSLVASTTKIMTALVICEECNVLEQVEVPGEATGVEGSSMYLRPGEVLTVQELLYGLMLSSGNDAAVALALHCAGSVESFAEKMNEKAANIGLRNTHFVNPHGLDAQEHYSTAEDLAVLAAYAMKNPIFARTVSTKRVMSGGRCLTNHNKLLWQYAGADGVKTGYTRAAGRILVSSAVRKERRLVCVTIDDGNDWADHQALYDMGFSRYHPCQVVHKGDSLGTLTVFGGRESAVNVISADDFSCYLAEGEQPQIVLSPKAFVYAPVVANGDAGIAYICVDGHPLGSVRVYFETTVERQEAAKQPRWRRWLGGKQ